MKILLHLLQAIHLMNIRVLIQLKIKTETSYIRKSLRIVCLKLKLNNKKPIEVNKMKPLKRTMRMLWSCLKKRKLIKITQLNLRSSHQSRKININFNSNLIKSWAILHPIPMNSIPLNVVQVQLKALQPTIRILKKAQTTFLISTLKISLGQTITYLNKIKAINMKTPNILLQPWSKESSITQVWPTIDRQLFLLKLQDKATMFLQAKMYLTLISSEIVRWAPEPAKTRTKLNSKVKK